MNSMLLLRLRFACKLTFAVLAALVVGFHFQLITPRWSALTAAIVTTGPAFAAGGEPFAGAIRHRGFLRVIGTFLGCFAALVLVMLLVRAPVLLMLFCCLWAGFCTWLSSLVRVENSYAWGLAGYTALIIVVTGISTPRGIPQFALERCSEIVLGICAAIVADLLFSPRSIKQDLDRNIDQLIVDQFALMRMSILQTDKQDVDKFWLKLVKSSLLINNMRSHLLLESARWQRCGQRLQAFHTSSLTLITQACETYLILGRHPERLPVQMLPLFSSPANSRQEVHQRLKQLRQLLALLPSEKIPLTISAWVADATRMLLLAKGVYTNSKISQIEKKILDSQPPVIKPASAERHHALINGLRTFVATLVGAVFWMWTGWSAGAGCMVIIAVICSLAMRTPNPRGVAMDFMVGMPFAFILGCLYFCVLIPGTQQSLLLLCLVLGMMTMVIGIEVQKRRLGIMALLAGTLNTLVLSNPMTFNFSSFLDSSLGQTIGGVIGFVVLTLIRDTSRERTGRTLLNQFMSSTVSALTTQLVRRQEDHLPALYHKLNQLMVMFPQDIDKFRLALMLIIGHQRLKMAEVPVNDELSALHKTIRSLSSQVVNVRSDSQRMGYYQRLLYELACYQEKLVEYQATRQVTEPVQRLVDMLHQYQHVFLG
jgi:p-hydroxybenzoic acid efflux pump subunit AaeB